jgi:hypothetical protein
MDTKSDNVQEGYGCFKRIYDPVEFQKANERNANPNIITGKDAVFLVYRIMGMEIDYDEIFAD